MTLADALSADRAGDIESAAANYEAALADGYRSLDALLNLALLYWQATDPGLSGAKKLGPELLAVAARRLPELLDEAQKRFPDRTETRFWKRYIAWADLGEPFEEDECRELLQEDPTALAPAMYLFAISEGRAARAEADELLRRCREDGTTGARYVLSVLEGVAKRQGRRP